MGIPYMVSMTLPTLCKKKTNSIFFFIRKMTVLYFSLLTKLTYTNLIISIFHFRQRRHNDTVLSICMISKERLYGKNN